MFSIYERRIEGTNEMDVCTNEAQTSLKILGQNSEPATFIIKYTTEEDRALTK